MASKARMDGLHKHQIIDVTDQHTGMGGGERLSTGHAAGGDRGKVKLGLVG